MECLNNVVDVGIVYCYGISNCISDYDGNGDEDCVMLSYVDRDQLWEYSIGNYDVGIGIIVVGFVSDVYIVVIIFESDYEDENSFFNVLDLRKWLKQVLLFSYYVLFRQISIFILLNFFILLE